MTHIVELYVDQDNLLVSRATDEQKQRIITDILEDNSFYHDQHPGPYRVEVSIKENKIFFNIVCQTNKDDATVMVSAPLQSLRRIIKDYSIVCDSYIQALQTAEPTKVEAIDMGRRSIHNEGAEELQSSLEDRISMDFETYRKFFTLIYLLQRK